MAKIFILFLGLLAVPLLAAGDDLRKMQAWWAQSDADHPGWSRLKYRLVADGGIHVPHVFYKVGAPRAAKGTLKAIRNRAEKSEIND